MVATPVKTKRLTVQVADLTADITAIRSLDWDRDRFDIEFGLQNGTTYNSYLIRGEKIALVDTSHEKFRQLYFDSLNGLINPQEIDYLIISHTEPDHSGLVRDILELAPNITVIGSKVAIQFLENLVHHPFQRQLVKNGDQLDLGNGHILEFVNAPNLHWPDTIFTYDHGSGILFTCDAFGMHYCSDDLYDEQLSAIEPDYRFYYECLMGPNARSVLAAMKRMEPLGNINLVANGHGPLLKHNVTELLTRYRDWSQAQTKAEKTVAVFYISDYGYSDRLCQSIAKGITKTGLAVETLDLKSADPQEVKELASSAVGIVIGTPPVSGINAQEITGNLGTILASVNPKQYIGMFESQGGDDESILPLFNKFREVGLTKAFDPIRSTETPNESLYQRCEEAGTDMGQLLTQEVKVKQRKSLDTDLDKAIGRISSGLYIITTKKGDRSGAMVASWVTQASFDPPGFTVAVAKDRAIESLMQVGDQFILNILEEGNYQTLMKHFLKRFGPGEDRFAGVNTRTAHNGSPILADALAYLECEVVSRMECADHWIVYNKVTDGRVSKPDSLTAVHHRKVGNYY
ncbi:MAG: MBL fold metallo-hydrolase [Microcystis panniformis Mp_MB_F_20051200_S9]|uniref:MBL fold metallo-hydrolase n=1 Tax=Microcystis panniformis Mp_MB_F_20051200_S9 TaxID=2486223 RepID=A0A552Q3Q9_9CHRO|nr:MAG: MBL fold metallo-hydrolase [Microcystis panniformis Mp_GB_SS_20050300_S99]TRV48433.1 MAG: MBL fold metallo-hydrolase [Microcystis panniformis Mp_GB_SS_20050300_S99D]TRV50068.1 MAG: MBL fold metallo-hydrolase [Microcystis panniformis Mp_MB_F_20080800_S26D]TRV58892.1 MAG: MBL fold metallo-hydrolase [Microcystis panniformis Mp_MB_F_20080800_S26]TRV63857.1 MAG: MBL fold metallo-hydrolase [Microcystis panniformis Mp_MB_F_20051200_S9]TRV69188.1 MAG: MBL fold metallo-hydrolase [Microcystis pa